MRIIDPQTGNSYVEKRRQRFNEPNQPRELTFSCYRGFPFLQRDRTREWFREALEDARTEFGFQLWAYVVMPDHIEIPITAGSVPQGMSALLCIWKEPIYRNGISILKGI